MPLPGTLSNALTTIRAGTHMAKTKDLTLQEGTNIVRWPKGSTPLITKVTTTSITVNLLNVPKDPSTVSQNVREHV